MSYSKRRLDLAWIILYESRIRSMGDRGQTSAMKGVLLRVKRHGRDSTLLDLVFSSARVGG
jgi:hypothetical protein